MRVLKETGSEVHVECICTSKVSPSCNKKQTLQLPRTGFIAWLQGELIQKAMPQVSKQERELLISGTCSPCFDYLFADH